LTYTSYKHPAPRSASSVSVTFYASMASSSQWPTVICIRDGNRRIPPQLLPLIRAYTFGYASSTLPRLLALLLSSLSGKPSKEINSSSSDFRHRVLRVFNSDLEFRRFPTFCAALVGGSSLLQIPLMKILERIGPKLSRISQKRLTIWLSTCISAWMSIKILQSKGSESYINRISQTTDGTGAESLIFTKYGGRTMDLTLFAIARAFDVVIGELWARWRTRRRNAKAWTKIETVISNLTDPALFAASSALIMWSWFYSPERLPRAYNKWISGAAAVDSRLIVALRRCRWGEITYGQDTGQAPLLQSMCSDYDWPLIWGDPAKTIPIPCEMVHMGCGVSCEYHALSRFLNGFSMAAGMYGTINLVMHIKGSSVQDWKKALISSARSSAFLGAFIALFYYGVCLSRTRLGPKLFGGSLKTRQRIDSGVCVASGCALCGWSILLEVPARRKNISLFVFPRAMATLLPRRYEMKYQWREKLAFALSTAVVFTCIQENPKRVRGVFGRVLKKVLQQ